MSDLAQDLGSPTLATPVLDAPARPFAGARAWLFAHRGRLVVGAFSLVGHLLVFMALLAARPDLPTPYEPAPMSVTLVELPRPEPPPAPKAPTPEPPSPAKPPPRAPVVRKTPTPPPTVRPLLAGKPSVTDSTGEMSDAQLASAVGAGSGPSGRACDIARWLQTALRKDPDVQAAASRLARPGRALMVWNGEWVRSGGEDGQGLAVIREAIMMEVLSMPAACRAEPMRGLFVISLSEGAGATRLGVGTGDWRWSELLVPRGGVPGHPSFRR